MNNRKAKLEKALAPSLPNDTIRFADMAWGIQCHSQRLEPLHAVLLEAVEALESILDVGESTMGLRVPNMNQTAREALAKIDEALDQQTKNSNS